MDGGFNGLFPARDQPQPAIAPCLRRAGCANACPARISPHSFAQKQETGHRKR
jgi:hypothetical protein